MSENLKTIKELADELGVSKTYIEKIIRVVNIHSELLKKKNRFFSIHILRYFCIVFYSLSYSRL